MSWFMFTFYKGFSYFLCVILFLKYTVDIKYVTNKHYKKVVYLKCNELNYYFKMNT